METKEIIPDFCRKKVLVLGCGNILFGDDGFGPCVIEYLHTLATLPQNCAFINVGTSAREILFDLILANQRPQRIIIVDCMEFGDREEN